MSKTKKAIQKRAPGGERVSELLYQALETELGGVEVYRAALECAQNDELREEWQKYLAQTEEHVEAVREICRAHGLDPDQDTPGRQIVRHIGKALVKAMQMALGSDSPESAQVVAAECVTLAETKDHLNWGLLGHARGELSGKARERLASAYERVEAQEDEHLYHTSGWARELWLQSLGLPARLPPPEEVADVKSADQAARAKKRSESARRG